MKFSTARVGLILSFILILSGCFQDNQRTRTQDNVVRKNDFYGFWHLDEIQIRSYGKLSVIRDFFDDDGNLGSASIEFYPLIGARNDRFLAKTSLQTSNDPDNPSGVIEQIEGDLVFSNGAMIVNTPDIKTWDLVQFKITSRGELAATISSYNPAIGAPFNKFYDYIANWNDQITLIFDRTVRILPIKQNPDEETIPDPNDD